MESKPLQNNGGESAGEIFRRKRRRLRPCWTVLKGTQALVLGEGVAEGSWLLEDKMENGKWKMENPSVEIFDSPIFKLTPCLPSIPTLQTGPSWTSRSVALASCFSRVSSVVSRGFDVEEPRVRV